MSTGRGFESDRMATIPSRYRIMFRSAVFAFSHPATSLSSQAMRFSVVRTGFGNFCRRTWRHSVTRDQPVTRNTSSQFMQRSRRGMGINSSVAVIIASQPV